MSHPLSIADFLQEAFTDDHKTKLQTHITAVMQASADEVVAKVKKELASSIDDFVCQPMYDIIENNNGEYEWVEAIKDNFWSKLLQSRPDSLHQYQLNRLFEAWFSNYPEQAKELCDKQLLAEIESLKRQIYYLNIR